MPSQPWQQMRGSCADQQDGTHSVHKWLGAPLATTHGAMVCASWHVLEHISYSACTDKIGDGISPACAAHTRIASAHRNHPPQLFTLHNEQHSAPSQTCMQQPPAGRAALSVSLFSDTPCAVGTPGRPRRQNCSVLCSVRLCSVSSRAPHQQPHASRFESVTLSSLLAHKQMLDERWLAPANRQNVSISVSFLVCTRCFEGHQLAVHTRAKHELPNQTHVQTSAVFIVISADCKLKNAVSSLKRLCVSCSSQK